MLPNGIPKSFEHFRDAMIFVREKTIKLEEVIAL